MISANEYASRREKVFEKMAEGSALVVFSGLAKKSSADETYPFEVNRNFYYLTGIQQEDSALLLVKVPGDREAFLFISDFDPVKEKWYGRKLTPLEARASSGVNNVLVGASNALEAKLKGILDADDAQFGKVHTLYLDLEEEQKVNAEGGSIDDFSRAMSIAYDVQIRDCYPLIVRLRMVKSEAEIAELREAIRVTKLGILGVMAKARVGVKEYELADEFLRIVNDNSAYQGLAFPTIMASGAHGACLHYPTPLDEVKLGDLILMDLGARNGLYCADVTRTIPSSGTYSDFQRTVYEIVLGCNQAVASFARPGVTLGELNDHTIEYLASECYTKGLINRKEDIVNYYFHHVSHSIGLDTHDPIYSEVDPEPGKRYAGRDKDYYSIPLVTGMVISDEPGLYMADRGIGIRVEDDLLITSNGCERLTEAIFESPADIEAFYANGRK